MNDKAERQAARVWTEDAQTKIQQTTEYPAKTGKVLRIAAARNEYRGAQIEVFALQDISGFDESSPKKIFRSLWKNTPASERNPIRFPNFYRAREFPTR